MNCEFHPDALAEYEAAIAYYAERDLAVARRFVAAVEDAIERIVQAPTRWRILDDDVRSGSSVPARQRGTSGKSMKKISERMRPEYDFSGGARGRYAKRYAEGTNVVVLDPDVSEVFSDSASVNRALRALAEVIHDQSSSKRAPKG